MKKDEGCTHSLNDIGKVNTDFHKRTGFVLSHAEFELLKQFVNFLATMHVGKKSSSNLRLHTRAGGGLK